MPEQRAKADGGRRRFSDAERELIRRTQLPEQAGEAELALLLHFAETTGLDPLLRQVWVSVRQGRAVPQCTIDGFRVIASRSGLYEGQTRPEWCGADGAWREVWTDDKPPFAARIGVYRRGFREAVYSVARYASYVQTARTDGGVRPNAMWAKMGDNQLLKCAEALALRKAFPDLLSGLYADAEMAQADSDETETAHRPASGPKGHSGGMRATEAGRAADADAKRAPGAIADAAPAPESIEAQVEPSGNAQEAPARAGGTESADGLARGQAAGGASARGTMAAPTAEEVRPSEREAFQGSLRPAATARPKAAGDRAEGADAARILDPVREQAARLGVASQVGAVFKARYGHLAAHATLAEAREFAVLAAAAPGHDREAYLTHLKSGEAPTSAA